MSTNSTTWANGKWQAARECSQLMLPFPAFSWSVWPGSNRRPLGPEPSALPDCATHRKLFWCLYLGSNQGPIAYRAIAATTELHRRRMHCRGGRTRTFIARIWSPPFCQLELHLCNALGIAADQAGERTARGALGVVKGPRNP